MDVTDVVLDASEEAGEEAQERRLFELIFFLAISATLTFGIAAALAALTYLFLLFFHFGLLLRNFLPKPFPVCLAILPLGFLDHGIVLAFGFVLAVHKMVHLYQIIDLIFAVIR